MIQRESRNDMNKTVRIPINKKRETPTPHNACNPLQIPNQQKIATNLDMQIQRVRTSSKCVRIN